MHAEPSLSAAQPLWTPTSDANVRGLDVKRFAGYDAVRIVLGLVLLTAAALKGYQLATEPVAETSLLTSRWFLIRVVEFEFVFGIWLLANIWAKPSWAAALACFGLFTCVSLYKAILGHASCGCFGQVPVNPWYTGTLDLAVVVSLVRWRPRVSFFTIRRPIAVVVIWLAVGVPAAFAMGSYSETTLSDAGEIIGNGKIVVLKPETWVGKRFPLLGHIDVGHKLTNGLWLVLLHRRDCSACREAVEQYELLAKEFSANSKCPTVALIECPPCARNAKATSNSLLRGHVNEGRQWQLPGPTSILIDAGQVQSVFTNARDIELLKAIWGGNET